MGSRLTIQKASWLSPKPWRLFFRRLAGHCQSRLGALCTLVSLQASTLRASRFRHSADRRLLVASQLESRLGLAGFPSRHRLQRVGFRCLLCAAGLSSPLSIFGASGSSGFAFQLPCRCPCLNRHGFRLGGNALQMCFRFWLWLLPSLRQS